MSGPYLSIERIERRLSAGSTEELEFAPGVNVLVGAPNTGKTKWLETLDFLLGDPDQNPFAGAEETGLDRKYEAAGASLRIGAETFWIERRWRQAGAKTKVFVDDAEMPAPEFQNWLMHKLEIPIVNFPKGNPMSGQTWPQLSFRMLLRHIHRRQKFWGDLADKQPEGEQHACLLQFLGLAETLFSEDYARLVELKMESEELKARRDQYSQTLEDITRDVLSEPGLTVGISATTLRSAEERLHKQIEGLREQRTALLSNAQHRAIESAEIPRVAQLGSQRAQLLFDIEALESKFNAASERFNDLRRYRSDLGDELERITRAEDAGAVLSDLKITHCPACDQAVLQTDSHSDQCFLCQQHISDGAANEELGAVRVRFEHDRLTAELKEAEDITSMLEKETKKYAKAIASYREKLNKIENELAPARQAVSALAQDEISAIDMALGEAHERQSHLSRVSGALAVGEEMTDRVRTLEHQITPIQERFDEARRAIDFDACAALLEEGMNSYLSAIEGLRPGAWLHNEVRVDISSSNFKMRIGTRPWSAVLGGTDTLYFLMAYHYGLLSLSDKVGFHYPGLSIIDVPGEFLGEAVEDKENFIVQPFVDLLSRNEFHGTQLIISGASFSGLHGVQRRHLDHVYVA